jgi:ankyrin repeat protein
VLSILSKIIETDNKAAIKSKDNSGLLPIHIYLLKSKVNMEVLSLLLSSYPESARIEYPNNLFPLYVVLDREDTDFDAFKALCKYHPEGVTLADSNGSLPLHIAINKKKPNLKIINQLLKK